jgi:hypothetical protein
MKRLQIIIVLVVIFMLLKPVAACSYYEYPSVCDAYGSAEAIFVGTVLKIVEVKNLEAFKTTNNSTGKEELQSFDGYKHYIKVEKTYKGNPQSEILLATLNTGCRTAYKVGDKLLLYVRFSKELQMWKFSTYRNAALQLAGDDLLFHEGLPKTLNRTRISGSLFNFDTKADSEFIKLSGIKLKIQSKNKTFEVTTDENGVYEIYDLPLGAYTITPEIPNGLKLMPPLYQGFGRIIRKLPTVEDSGKNSAWVDLKETRCIGVGFSFEPERKSKID